MRRLCAASIVLASFAFPVTARAEAARLPYRDPGAHALSVAADAATWQAQQLEAASGGSRITQQIQRRLDEAKAEPAAGTYDLTFADAFTDLDGDGVAELLVVRMRFTFTEIGFVGDLDLTARSGRTGAKRWSHHYADGVSSALIGGKVGAAGKPGLVLVSFVPRSRTQRDVRLVGIDGRTGKHVYDKRFKSDDGLGDVQFGGPFDAYPRGGTDVLIGRVRGVAAIPLEGLQLLEVQPFALDGATGAVRSVRDPALVVGKAYTYLTVGDVDGDNRDDFLGVRKLLDGKGDVTAYGVVENEVHWATDGVPVGYYLGSGGVADVVGDKKEDVLLNTWVVDKGLLEIDGVTDGIPLLGSPPQGIRGVLLDGATGAVQWDRLDGELASYEVWNDVNRDHKADVLSTSMITGSRDGLRALVVSGANKVLRRKDITVQAPVGRRSTGIAVATAGDLDGDKVADLAYYIGSASLVQVNTTQGFLLLGPVRAVTTFDYPLYGTVDGGTAERTRYKRTGSGTSFTIADGWHGGSYWTVTASASDSYFGIGAHPGARGRCDGVLLYAAGPGNATWVYALDGATGRVRWSVTLTGHRPAVRLTVSGRAARCR